VPTKIIGYRFSEEGGVQLLRSEWWNLSPNEVNKLGENE
jgi:hypothetical protein